MAGAAEVLAEYHRETTITRSLMERMPPDALVSDE